MARAFSYLRFSSAEQMKGDSFRRQSKLAEQYAAAHKLTLDTDLTFHDLGVSAFRGANIETGQLGAFLEAVKVGLVPQGSYLLVESLDRVSRKSARKAVRVLEDIVESGVTVVTLNDSKAYTEESLDGFDFLMAVLILIRSHEESDTKSRRLKAAWEGKRLKAGERAMTSHTPGWIELDDDRQTVLIEDRAAIVRRIFSLYLDGHGKESIARTFNQEGIKPFGRAQHWHRSYIDKILQNPSVVGTFTPRTLEHIDGKKVRIDQEPIHGYFPAAIDSDTWERAQVLLLSNGKGRGRHSGKAVKSLLATLAACPKCNATMTRVTKGGKKGGKPYLVCTVAKAGKGCKYKAVRQDDVERALLDNPAALVADMPHSDADLGSRIDTLETQEGVIADYIENVTDEIQKAPSDALRKRLASLEAQQAAIAGELTALSEQAARSESRMVEYKANALREALSAPEADPQAINVALRSMLCRVVIDYRTGFLELHWLHGGTSSVLYTMPRVPKDVLESLREKAQEGSNAPPAK